MKSARPQDGEALCAAFAHSAPPLFRRRFLFALCDVVCIRGRDAFRAVSGGELDAFACDFAGDDRLRRAYRDEHITLDDIVKGDGPFRFVVPEQLFSAGFVYPRTRQL